MGPVASKLLPDFTVRQNSRPKQQKLQLRAVLNDQRDPDLPVDMVGFLDAGQGDPEYKRKAFWFSDRACPAILPPKERKSLSFEAFCYWWTGQYGRFRL
jgi:hypothetical protein